MRSEFIDPYNLDHRVMFVAACSSFITLFLLSILGKCHLFDYEENEETLPVHHVDRKNINSDFNKHEEKDMEESIPRSPLLSSKTVLFEDMMDKDFYIHALSDNYFESDDYLNRIPLNNSNWINNKLKLLITTNYTDALHHEMLDNFHPKLIEPVTNGYISEIIEAMNRFNEWRRWPNNDGKDINDGWKYRATKNNMNVYTHSLPLSELDIVKCEKILSYPIHIIIGTLMNKKHVLAMDPVIKSMDILEQPSLSSAVIHLCCKCPFPLTDRDFVNIAMIYIFKDGSCLMGNTSCNNHDELIKINKNYVRATVTMSMYHIRPYYDGDIQQTKVTFYSHVLMNGSIPQWMLNFAYMEIAESLLKMEKYIARNWKNAHKPGQLHIIPNPYLKMINL